MRFFFDLIDGLRLVADEQGIDCRGLAEARQRAVGTLVELAGDLLPGGHTREMAVHVRDDMGELLVTVSIRIDGDPSPDLIPTWRPLQ